MLRLKSCPRCKGDILIDRDHISWYEQCLQCGYQRDLTASEAVAGHDRKSLKNIRSKTGFIMGVTK